MIFKVHELEGIKSGAVTHVFRRWEKSAVKKGGSQKTHVGVIRFDDVVLFEKAITKGDAKKAGYETVDDLVRVLDKWPGKVYRIKVSYASEDPRLELRERTELGEEDYLKLKGKLDRLDKTRGPWVLKVLTLIKRNPERRAAELADVMQMDKFDFKINVRKLKNLGLTVSHEIGYSISPLGDWVMGRMKKG